MKQYDLYINGELKSSKSGRYFDSVNPSTGQIFSRVADATLEDMQFAIQTARHHFDEDQWAEMLVRDRGQFLIKIAGLIRDHAKELADLETSDTGKTIKQTTFIDVPTCADTFEYFGNIGQELRGSINDIPAPVKSLTEREPLGVVGCTIPWNYPLIMSAWKIAPALIAGNTVILKPSSQGCVSVMRLAELIKQSGIPQGVLQIVPTKDHRVAAELAKSSLIDKFSFTGGTKTGQDVMRMAAGNLKRLTLELGGKSPNIVFADCDQAAALGGTMSAIFMNQGQMCTAGSRLLLEDKIYDSFLSQLVNKTKNLKIGAADQYDTDFGPLTSARHRESIMQFIKGGRAEGASVLCGGNIPEEFRDHKGFYFEPTILGQVTNDMDVAQQEAFGPVLCVIKFSGAQEAIRLANDSCYGLASCVWTKNLRQAHSVAKQLRCGTVWVNTYGGFYNEAPYGGYKQSGFGRELGLEGLLEYTQTKHVCIDMTPGGKALVTNWF
ncbi:MAG: aldehyde dehydrogenase family protein [Candidatus Omnitrophica bacterium]|nr:aldehyde dehydrogenase family protein [Candidatus Omnitrophota bacterium]